MFKNKSLVVNKILGFGLLLGGVAIIIWGIQASFGIFLHNQPPPEIFVAEVNETNELEQEEIKQEAEPSDMALIIQALEDAGHLPPPGAPQKILNLVFWGFFMAILFIGGTRLATIGIQLISIKNGKK